MAHREIALLNSSNLSSIAYEYNGDTMENIKVFRFKLSTAKLVPAALDRTRTTMSQINPIGESPTKVMAKTNAATMEGNSGTGFYGIFYANKQLFCSGKKISSPYEASGSAVQADGRGIPHLIIKNDGTVKLRWFDGTSDLARSYEACEVIIAGAHPLLVDGDSVFEVSKLSEGKRIANGSNLNDTSCRFNNSITEGSAGSPHARTMLGVSVRSGKAYEVFMVVTDGMAPMHIFTAAHLMQDLGCNVAINLDGGSASHMRVASGYTNNIKGISPGRVTIIGSDSKTYGSAVCAVKR